MVQKDQIAPNKIFSRLTNQGFMQPNFTMVGGKEKFAKFKHLNSYFTVFWQIFNNSF